MWIVEEIGKQGGLIYIYVEKQGDKLNEMKSNPESYFVYYKKKALKTWKRKML